MQGRKARGLLLYRAEVEGKDRADVDPTERRETRIRVVRRRKRSGKQEEIGGKRQCRSCACCPTAGYSWTEGVWLGKSEGVAAAEARKIGREGKGKSEQRR